MQLGAIVVSASPLLISFAAFAGSSAAPTPQRDGSWRSSSWQELFPEADLVSSVLQDVRVRRREGDDYAPSVVLKGKTLSVQGPLNDQLRTNVARLALTELLHRRPYLADVHNPFWWDNALDRKTNERQQAERLLHSGARRLASLPTQDPSFDLFWDLKLRSEHSPIPGDVHLLVGHVFSRSNEPLSFGHVTIGLLRDNNDPSDDFVLDTGGTPGDRLGRDDGAHLGNFGALNASRVHNLWDWMHTQAEGRNLDFDFEVFALDATQAEGLKTLVEISDGRVRGRYDLLSENCVHGSMDFLNILRPLGSEIRLHALIDTPVELVHKASAAFPSLGTIQVRGPKGVGRTKPPIYDFPVVADRTKTLGWQAFLEWQAGH